MDWTRLLRDAVIGWHWPLLSRITQFQQAAGASSEDSSFPTDNDPGCEDHIEKSLREGKDQQLDNISLQQTTAKIFTSIQRGTRRYIVPNRRQFQHKGQRREREVAGRPGALYEGLLRKENK